MMISNTQFDNKAFVFIKCVENIGKLCFPVYSELNYELYDFKVDLCKYCE